MFRRVAGRQGWFSVFQPRMDAHRKTRAESEGDIPKFLSQAGETG